MNGKAIAGLAGTALLAFLGWAGVTLHGLAVDHEKLEVVVRVWHSDERPADVLGAAMPASRVGAPSCDCQAAAFRLKAIKRAIVLIDERDYVEAREVLTIAAHY